MTRKRDEGYAVRWLPWKREHDDRRESLSSIPFGSTTSVNAQASTWSTRADSSGAPSVTQMTLADQPSQATVPLAADADQSEEGSSQLFGADITLPSTEKSSTAKQSGVSSSLVYSSDVDVAVPATGDIEIKAGEKSGSARTPPLNPIPTAPTSDTEGSGSNPVHSDKAVAPPPSHANASPVHPHRTSDKPVGKKSTPPDMIAIPILASEGPVDVDEVSGRPDDVSAITNPTAVRTLGSRPPWIKPMPIDEYEEFEEEKGSWWSENKRCIIWTGGIAVAVIVVVASIMVILNSVGVLNNGSSEAAVVGTGQQTSMPNTLAPTSPPDDSTLLPTTPPPGDPTSSPSTTPPVQTSPPESTDAPSTSGPTSTLTDPPAPTGAPTTPVSTLPPTEPPSTTDAPTTPVSTFPPTDPPSTTDAPITPVPSASPTETPASPTPDLDLDGARVSVSSNGVIIGVGLNGIVETYRLSGNMTEVASPTTSPSGFLVTALSGDGSRMVVGAEDSGLYGLVQVWSRDVGGSDSDPWTPLGDDLIGAEIEDQFGQSVAISADGTTIAVGAPGANEATGQVTCYRLVGDLWATVGSANGLNPADTFGTSVSLSGDGSMLAVGAPQRNVASGKGYVQMYTLSEASMSPSGELIEGEGFGDRFGFTVSVSDDESAVAVGAWGNDANGENSGSARVFSLSGNMWVPVGSVVTGDAAGDAFGYSVSLGVDGTFLAVGAPQSFSSKDGYIRAFRYASGTWATAQTYLGQSIEAESGEIVEQLGFSVSLGQDSTLNHIIWGTSMYSADEYLYGFVSFSRP